MLPLAHTPLEDEVCSAAPMKHGRGAGTASTGCGGERGLGMVCHSPPAPWSVRPVGALNRISVER